MSNFVGKLLKFNGLLVECASTCKEALDKLNTREYALMLLDVKLPDMNGIDFFCSCKKGLKYTQTIVITGAPDLEAAVNIVKEGAFDYLPKPFTNEKLLEKVKEALKHRKEKIMTDLEQTAEVKNEAAPGYCFVRELGSGSMGDVLLACKDNIYYAVKKFRTLERCIDLDDTAQKFIKVINEASHIIHPNVIKIFEYGFPRDGTTPYIVMEYVPGNSLTHYIGGKDFTFEEKVKIISDISEAVECIHDCGILHRDIKPANILVDENDQCVKITDFGISSFLDRNCTITENLRGTPAYMAPECFDSTDKICKASDIFSLGVLAYELLTGIRPFYGENISEIMLSVKNDTPPAPKMIIPDIPEHIQETIQGMLKKEPEKRLTSKEIQAGLKS
jgi:CheY-like chemotaxis protein